MISEGADKSIHKWILAVTATAFFTLAINAFWAFEYKRAALDQVSITSVDQVVRPSWLISRGTLHKRKLDSEIERLSQPLEFMVWPRERKLASRKLQSVLHQRINISPFDTLAWRHLSFAQAYIESPIEERAWTIATGVKIGGWRTAERLLFTRNCIVEYDVFESILPLLCQRLIKGLPSDRSSFRLAQDMGVNQRHLEWLLLHSSSSAENDLRSSESIKKARQ